MPGGACVPARVAADLGARQLVAAGRCFCGDAHVDDARFCGDRRHVGGGGVARRVVGVGWLVAGRGGGSAWRVTVPTVAVVATLVLTAAGRLVVGPAVGPVALPITGPAWLPLSVPAARSLPSAGAVAGRRRWWRLPPPRRTAGRTVDDVELVEQPTGLLLLLVEPLLQRLRPAQIPPQRLPLLRLRLGVEDGPHQLLQRLPLRVRDLLLMLQLAGDLRVESAALLLLGYPRPVLVYVHAERREREQQDRHAHDRPGSSTHPTAASPMSRVYSRHCRRRAAGGPGR